MAQASAQASGSSPALLSTCFRQISFATSFPSSVFLEQSEAVLLGISLRSKSFCWKENEETQVRCQVVERCLKKKYDVPKQVQQPRTCSVRRAFPVTVTAHLKWLCPSRFSDSMENETMKCLLLGVTQYKSNNGPKVLSVTDGKKINSPFPIKVFHLINICTVTANSQHLHSPYHMPSTYNLIFFERFNVFAGQW